MSCDKCNGEETGLFVRPMTFSVTHVLFPVITLANVGWGYWMTCDALAGEIALKAKVLLWASVALPCLSLAAAFLFRRRRIPTAVLSAFLILGVAYLYFGFPIELEMLSKGETWATSSLSPVAFFLGVLPMVYAGIAQLATRDWGLTVRNDVCTSLILVVLPPGVVYLTTAVLFKPWFPKSANLIPCLLCLCTIVFFIGLLRLMATVFCLCRPFAERSSWGRIVAAAAFALVLPLGGLALNLSIPFPADFANVWAWGLAVFTGIALMLPVSATRWGLSVYALRFVAAPFVAYFFILFLPFMPLALPAILFAGLGFLILAPICLAVFWVRSVKFARRMLLTRFPRWLVALVALAGLMVIPSVFVIRTEMERRDVQALVAWQADDDFAAPPKPLPMPAERAKRVMRGVNAYTFGAEIPYLSAWRTFRVYDGMYLSDRLRNRLNCRIFGCPVEEDAAVVRETRKRNGFAAFLFGFNPARWSFDRGRGWAWPQRTLQYAASARSVATNGVEALYVVSIHTVATGEKALLLDFRLPAGAWIEGLRLKMFDGMWKTARFSERKSAEWVYNQITRVRRDPSIVTLDTPTEGRIRVYPVDGRGRDVELTLRLPFRTAAKDLIAFCPPPLQGHEPGVSRRNRRERAAPVEKPVWKAVSNPDWQADSAEARRIYTVGDAAVSIIPAGYFAAHTNEIVSPVMDDAPTTFEDFTPDLYGKLRRLARARAGGRTLPRIEFTVPPPSRTNGNADVTNAPAARRMLEREEWIALRRELPGMTVFGDRPLDGYLPVTTADGRTLFAPYRKGEGTLLFERLKDAAEVGGLWREGAKAWAIENRAFLRPALDVRRELLSQSRGCQVLTTKSAFIALETATQEKGLHQKEREALYGNQAFEFDESGVDADAPGFGLMVLLFLASLLVASLRRRQGVRAALQERGKP